MKVRRQFLLIFPLTTYRGALREARHARQWVTGNLLYQYRSIRGMVHKPLYRDRLAGNSLVSTNPPTDEKAWRTVVSIECDDDLHARYLLSKELPPLAELFEGSYVQKLDEVLKLTV